MRIGLNTYEESDWLSLAKCNAAGTEFDWFARDTVGHLAVFTSAGSGPIPRAVWDHLHEYNALLTFVDSLPRGAFIQVLQGAGHYEDWQDFAASGLFGFDYQDVHRGHKRAGYDLITRPASALQTDAVPAALLRCVPVLDTAFSTAAFVPDRIIVAATHSHA